MTNWNYQLTHFVTSAPDIRHLPADTGIEVAFAGRSNAGKSSALNTLTNQKNLARTSKTPGRTQLINLFEVAEGKRLVDLPGYGYAKRSFSERDKWKKLIDRYFSLEAPRLYLQLVDLKVGLTADDRAMLSFLVETELPFAVVATKSDKVNTTTRLANLEALHNDPSIPSDAEIIPFSAKTGAGAEEIWRVIKEFSAAVTGTQLIL